MSLSDFKGLIGQHNGLAKPTAFQVILPTFGLSVDTMRNVNLLCNAATMPGDQIVTNDRAVGLKTELMPYTYSQSDIQLTFYDTNRYFIKQYFDLWKKHIVNMDGTLNFKDKFAHQVDIYQLSQALPWTTGQTSGGNNYVYGVRLFDAFPTTITQIELSASSQNATVEVNVQLSYSKWESIALLSQTGSNSQSNMFKNVPAARGTFPEGMISQMQSTFVEFGGMNPNAGTTNYTQAEIDSFLRYPTKRVASASSDNRPAGPGGNGGV